MPKVPELRFAGFDEQWVEKRLKQTSQIIGGGTPSTKNEEYWNGNINWFTPTEIDSRRYFSFSERKITEKAISKSSAKILDKDKTVLFTSRATIGEVGLLKKDSTTNQGFQSLVINDNFDLNFMYSIAQTLKKKALSLSVGSTFKEISKSSFEDIKIYTPIKEEQEKIGDLFKNIDQLIENQETLVEETKNFKKSMVQKMFPKKDSLVPEFRFDGYYENWNYSKLSNISERITRRNSELESELPLTISAELGLVNQLDYYNFRVASKDISSYYLIYNGEFAYNKSTSLDAPYGAIKRLDHYPNGALSTLYIVFNIVDANSEFIKYYFETYYWHKHIYKIAQEGARNHGLLNLNVTDFFDMDLKIPSLEEQEKIGTFFKNLDEKIEKEQDLLDKYKSMKKSLLQKMFV